MYKRLFGVWLCGCALSGAVSAQTAEAPLQAQSLQSPLSLSQVLAQVEANDFTLQRKQFEASAFDSEADAVADWPDPTVFAALQNLPTDSFSFSDEGMTNLRVGIKQMLPQGDTLMLRQQMAHLSRDLQTIEASARRLQLQREAALAWYEAWYWQKNLDLIEEDRVFVTQVLDFVRSMYQVGMRNQSDLIGAEYELLRLDERQIEARRKYQVYRSELDTLANAALVGQWLSAELPEQRLHIDAPIDQESLLQDLARHPIFSMQEQKVQLSGRQVALAEQAFAPNWGLELSYGLRNGSEMNGGSRPDLLSAGVSVQWPLFSNAKQSHQLRAARQRQAAQQNARDEALQKLRYQFLNLHQQYLDTAEHRKLYEREILPTLAAQKQTALNSYQADKGDFRLVSELLRKEQNARIQQQRLRVDEQKLLAQLNYWLPGTETEGAQAK